MMGIVRRMIEVESMMQPRIRNTTMKPAMITHGGTGSVVAPSLIRDASPRW